MPFNARAFAYDSTPSELYSLYLSELDPGAIFKTAGSSSMDILNQKIYRRSKPFFYGATPSQNLSFPITAHSYSELTAADFELVQRWLFSSRQYKKLQIFQNDLSEVYFNAIFNNPQITRIGNQIVGFEAEVQCDAPWGYMYPKTTTYTYTASDVNSLEAFYNSSNDSGDYLYPTLVITMNTFGEDVTITNISDSSRVFSFTTGLSAGEVLTINNDLQTITSSTLLRRLSLFNKNWFRLVPGANSFRVEGNVASISMTCSFIAKKIGG